MASPVTTSNGSSGFKRMKPKKGARDRLHSVDRHSMLKNKKFSYLFQSPAISPGLNSSVSSLSPHPENGSPAYSPSLSPNQSKEALKQQFKRVRKSSVSVETTSNHSQQLAAIKKEAEFLQKEVPHFNDLYRESVQAFAVSQRKKADIESFALIQAMTQWIVRYGNNAVQSYDDFKETAESEILNMVTQVEALQIETQKLQLLNENLEIEHENAKQQLQQKEFDATKYEKEAASLKRELASSEMNDHAIKDMEVELIERKKDNQTLKEKYERIENYWKMTQKENEELRNKNYGYEHEIENLRKQLQNNSNNMNNMTLKHQSTVHKLQTEHAKYTHQMEEEQERLIQAAQDSNDASNNMIGSTPAAFIEITAEDDDIGDSGVMDGGDDDYAQHGVFTLSQEIDDVYEYEDDGWLDSESEDFEIDDCAPVIIMEEESNKQLEFEMVKESHHQDIEYRDLSRQFSSQKLEFGQEQQDVTSGFSMQTESTGVEQEAPKVEEKEPSPEPMQFESEKVTYETPEQEKPIEFEMEKQMVTVEEDKSPSPMQFSSEKTKMSAKNEMVHKDNIPKPKPKPIYKNLKKMESPRPADYEKETILGGSNFSDRLAMFRHLERTKGGKPQVDPNSKAYVLLNKWTAGADGKDKDSKVHITKSTKAMPNDAQNKGKQVNVIKITKTKHHKLKARMSGNMKIVRTKFLARWIAAKRPEYFFVLDGLPSQTNVVKNEPDFAKNRSDDFLVPCLFFFENKENFEVFQRKTKNHATRDLFFQKEFPKFAKGIFPLNKYVVGANVHNCLKRLISLNKRSDLKFPKQEIQETGKEDDLCVLICAEKEIHRFHCADKESRDRWVGKINKLVDKRRDKLKNLNDQYGGNLVADTGGFDTPDTPDTPGNGSGYPSIQAFSPNVKSATPVYESNVVPRSSRASIAVFANIKKVEEGFD